MADDVSRPAAHERPGHEGPGPERPGPEQPGHQRLEEELRALGRALSVEPPRGDLADAVLARIDRDPVPIRSAARQAPTASGGAARRWGASWAGRARRSWRVAVAVLLGLLVALALGTPASARIAEWLGLGGVVVVRTAPPALPTPGPPGPSGGTAVGPAPPEPVEEVTLAGARERVPFALGVPGELGDPDSVTVTVGAATPVVTMLWHDGGAAGVPLRLDQFAGRPAPVFLKVAPVVERTTVGTAEALWLDRPHPLVYTDTAGAERTASARTSGPALVWQRGTVTLRLEGVAERDRAVAVAASVPD